MSDWDIPDKGIETGTEVVGGFITEPSTTPSGSTAVWDLVTKGVATGTEVVEGFPETATPASGTAVWDLDSKGIATGSEVAGGFPFLGGTVSACTSIAIDSITNNNDGSTVTIVLSGVPNGPVVFHACRTPDMAAPNLVTGTLTSAYGVIPATYVVKLTHPSLWYIVAMDSSGTSPVAAVWMDYSTDVSDLDLIGMNIRDILLANKLGIEYILKLTHNAASLEQVVYGYEGAIVDYPSILISSPRVQERYVAVPYGREATFTYTIQCFVVHSTDQTELPLLGQFARAVQMILNQPANETFVIGNQMTINFNFISDVSIEEYEQADKFMSVGTMIWSGSTIYTDTGN